MNDKKYVISEFYAFNSDKSLIVESEGVDNGLITLVGILQKADTLNRNGRIYPYEILKREATKYMELVNEKMAYSELDHPASSVVSFEKTSHMIIDLWWENKNLMGKLVVFDGTPSGAIVKEVLKKGGTIGISSRGLGTVKTVGGKDIVQDDFELIAFDIVTSPSTPGAYMFKEGYKPGMTEIDSSGIYSHKKKIQEENEANLTKLKTLTENLNNDFWKNL